MMKGYGKMPAKPAKAPALPRGMKPKMPSKRGKK
jgi:hypothetical protein